MSSAWLEARTKGLGGSDIAALLGLSQWSSPLTLWADKTGRSPDENLDAKEHIEWGNRLESAVIEAYWERTQRVEKSPVEVIASDNYTAQALDHYGEQKLLMQSVEHPWALATIDGMISEYAPFPWESHADERFKGPGVLEAKTTNAFNKSDWADGPPPHYLVQAQHYMLVTGLTWASFAVLIGGQQMRCFDIARDNEMIDEIRIRGETFWRVNVLGDKMPMASGVKSESSLIDALLPPEVERMIELNAGADIQIGVIRRVDAAIKPLRAKLKELETLKEGARSNIRLAMGSATRAVASDGTSFTYKTTTRKGYVVQTKSSRMLRMSSGRKSST